MNNPVKDRLRLQFDNLVNESARIQLYTSNGRRVLDRTIQNIGGTATIEVSTLASGLYLAKVQNQNQQGIARIVIGE